jgi:hypothetical protein
LSPNGFEDGGVTATDEAVRGFGNIASKREGGTMARLPGREKIYEVADLFRERCLRDGTSLLWPEEHAWSVANLTALWNAFLGHPDSSDLAFSEKWAKQLKNEPDDVHRIAADILAFYYLFPTTDWIRPEKKLQQVMAVVGWRLGGQPPGIDLLKQAFAKGIGSAGTNYNTSQPQQIAFYLEFCRRLLSEGIDCHDPKSCRVLADKVCAGIKNSGNARNVLLHLLFPNQFERIASRRQKQEIVKAFPDEAEGVSDVDDALLKIRQNLTAKLNRTDVDFYDDALRKRWQHVKGPSGGKDGETGTQSGGQTTTITGTTVTEGAGSGQLGVSPYTLEQCALDTGLAESRLKRWIAAVERKGQAVIYGPPGTGKTFVARKLACHLAGADGCFEVVQFHPSFSYEDFVQGIRPKATDDGNLDYPTVPGCFLEFCKRADSRKGTCVLIMDEINRANLSRVFGELMYLLEYRGEDVRLAGGQHFRIPKNVRLIGTMNTADRSIALVDHALRRRFAFLALWPDYALLKRYHESDGFETDGLIQVLKRVNTEIGDRHYEVGISFFLRPDLGKHIQDIWEMEIEPYLEEYFFDQPAKLKGYRWDAIEKEVIG